jgi:hypothetical protein
MQNFVRHGGAWFEADNSLCVVTQARPVLSARRTQTNESNASEKETSIEWPKICRPMRLGVQLPAGGTALQKISRFILAMGCMELAAYSQTVPVPDEGPAVFVFRIISVDAAQRDAFVACLAKSDLPFWRDLQKKGLLAKVSVFETPSVESSKPGVPAWNFVISSEVAPDATADSFLQALAKRKGCDSDQGTELRQIETLKTKPNTHYARATVEGDRIAREKKVEFRIEYIAVDPAKFDQWNEVYRLIGGPGVGLRIRDGSYFSADVMLTVKANYSQPGMPDWNTIHVLGGFPGSDHRAAAGANPGPTPAAYAAAMAPLRPFATFSREDRVRQLFELAVR